jgi:hypothetical protein
MNDVIIVLVSFRYRLCSAFNLESFFESVVPRVCLVSYFVRNLVAHLVCNVFSNLVCRVMTVRLCCAVVCLFVQCRIVRSVFHCLILSFLFIAALI